MFGRVVFVIDRDYDDNKMFLKLEALKQDYIIRPKSNRKLFYHNKWGMATEPGKARLLVRAWALARRGCSPELGLWQADRFR